MKKAFLLVVLSSIFISVCSAQEAAQSSQLNFTHFTKQQPKITKELEKQTGNEFKTHPEYGVVPFNAPCKDCYEVLQKRDEKHRYFLKEGSNGHEFYSQSSYSDLSYNDGSGNLRTIDYRLNPATEKGVYSASHQPFPVTVNLNDKYVSILNAGKEIQVNRHVSLFIKKEDGSLVSMGEPNWSNYTAGDDGVVVHNIYAGIDLEMHLGEGKVESFYRINKPLNLQGASLVIRDNMKLPEGLAYDYSYTEKKGNDMYEGALCINNSAGRRYYIIGSPAAFDENGGGEKDFQIGLQYGLNQNSVYDLYVPISWMNDASRSYPILIDPFVTATSSDTITNITGSGYNSTCFAGGCTYNLNVTVPPACTVMDVLYSFNYRALGTCDLNQGAWDLTYKTCRSPAAGGTWHTCTIGLPGLCILQNLSLFADVKTCIPAPQCASYSMPFVLTFYRCVQSGSGCGFSCINADTPWDMTVKGYTSVVTSVNGNVCEGSPFYLKAFGDSGVAPYSYKWYPGGLVTSDSVAVYPKTTTTYTVTESTCGGADSAQTTSTVTVQPNDNPGFTLSPNPVCPGAQLTVRGHAGRPITSYDWKLPGANPSSMNADSSFTASYSTPGTYNITLIDTSGICVFDSTLSITVSNNVATAGPDSTICSGNSVQLNASGGSNYTWTPAAGLNNTNTANPVATPSVTTTYTVTATSGTCQATATVTITVIPSSGNTPPVITVVPDTNAFTILAGDSIAFDVTLTGGSNEPVRLTATSKLLNGGYDASFSLPDSSTSTISRVFRYVSSCSDAAGSPFSIVFNGSNGLNTGCSTEKDTTFSVNIVVIAPSAGLLDTIPNIFTPNGDGKNDSLSLYHASPLTEACWTNFHVEIFNRWGEQQFESSDINFKWNGENKGGTKVSEGVYYYIITADFLGKAVSKRGTVNVKM